MRRPVKQCPRKTTKSKPAEHKQSPSKNFMTGSCDVDCKMTLEFAVLDNFSCGISVISISNCKIAVFIRTYGMRFFSIIDDIKNYPLSPPTFSEPYQVSNRERVSYILLIISEHANGCLFVLSKSKIT